jgi:hypothetical protein
VPRNGGGALQRELDRRIKTGRCVYCRAPAAPDRPLTREHVIPRARGGRRKDARIIVPACARCNHGRGCQEIVLFLLARPRRLVAFLDYLSTLPPDTVRELDIRVFAELYAALWLLEECAAAGGSWRRHLERLSSGRRLHRRRYAARRIVSAVGIRIERLRERTQEESPATCLLPSVLRPLAVGTPHGATAARALAALIGTLSLLWGASAQHVHDELTLELQRTSRTPEPPAPGRRASPDEDDEDPGVVSLDGWKRRRKGRRRRMRVDQRGGRAAATHTPRGRAA